VNERITDYQELREEIYCSQLFRSMFYFLKFYKGGITQSLLHQIKYAGNTELATLIGRWYGNILSEKGFGKQFDLIIPVPLHIRKLRKRGYNQSQYIVEGLKDSLNSKMDSKFLIRTKNNPTQTHKTRTERIENVSNIFKVNHTNYSKDIRILIVDDVITTGATLESCAKALNDAGYQNISFATVAYAKK
jgi:ComF family protein